jgi:hypothetical protein
VLHTYTEIIDFSGNEKVPDSEPSNLTHFCKIHMMKGLKSRDASAVKKQ